MHQTLRLCGQRVRMVYGDWQMFLPTENCTSQAMFLRQTACHRGWSPLPSPLPSLLPTLAAKPAALLAAGDPIPAASVEPVHLFRVIHSHTPARKSGTQSLPGMSCFVLRVLCIVIRGPRELSLGVCSLGGARIPSRAGDYYARGRGGM